MLNIIEGAGRKDEEFLSALTVVFAFLEDSTKTRTRSEDEHVSQGLKFIYAGPGPCVRALSKFGLA